jgi:hypothetical protein
MVSALLALVLASCSGGAPPPDPRPPTSTSPADSGRIDALPNFGPVVTVERMRKLLGPEVTMTKQPGPSEHILSWQFQGAVPHPGALSDRNVRVSAELVRSYSQSSVELARKFFRNGMLEPDKFEKITIAGADEAVIHRDFEDWGGGFTANRIRIISRTGNALIDLRYRNPALSKQDLASRAQDLVQDLVACFD